MGVKRKRTTTTKEDRLSSLPNDILIVILSRLQFQSAVVTETLSRRWRGLWKNATSVHINNPTSDLISSFISQFKSPVVDSFVVEFECKFNYLTGGLNWPNSMDSLLRVICDRNVRELSIRRNNCLSLFRKFQSFIFQTRSLVSLELCSTRNLDNTTRIDLPNLKNLKLNHSPSLYGWLGTLIKTCPSLEELVLVCDVDDIYLRDLGSGYYFKCSNQNLRRLHIHSSCITNSKFVINTPKLEYLDVRAQNPVTYFFEEEPLGLLDAKIIMYDFYPPLTKDEKTIISKFYETIRNVRSLKLDFRFVLYNMPIVFRNATRVTLDMKMAYHINFVLSLIDLCPVLDVLTLNFKNICKKPRISQTSDDVSTSARVIRRVEIETCWDTYNKPTETFIQLVEYLLSGVIDLKQFRFSVGGGKDDPNKSERYKRSRESDLCKLICKCPMVSMGCEVEFKGRYLKMFGKTSPKAWKLNGEEVMAKSLNKENYGIDEHILSVVCTN
ncbi:hypothetical protein RND81_06G202300 [Saponaria officinalis]|uniref:F-box domain-containing protein n=1 Tax=Saponaria officinalis TaxID=3572 RepID=A0AAW1K8J4_SAPOF